MFSQGYLLECLANILIKTFCFHSSSSVKRIHPHLMKYDKSAGKLVQEFLLSLWLQSEVFRRDSLAKRKVVAYDLKYFGCYWLFEFSKNWIQKLLVCEQDLCVSTRCHFIDLIPQKLLSRVLDCQAPMTCCLAQWRQHEIFCRQEIFCWGLIKPFCFLPLSTAPHPQADFMQVWNSGLPNQILILCSQAL